MEYALFVPLIFLNIFIFSLNYFYLEFVENDPDQVVLKSKRSSFYQKTNIHLEFPGIVSKT